jgi:hypothetical protein
MLKQLKSDVSNVIEKLHKEFSTGPDTFCIPTHYVVVIDFIELFLRLAKIFTNDATDEKIDKILAAIELFHKS